LECAFRGTRPEHGKGKKASVKKKVRGLPIEGLGVPPAIIKIVGKKSGVFVPRRGKDATGETLSIEWAFALKKSPGVRKGEKGSLKRTPSPI